MRVKHRYSSSPDHGNRLCDRAPALRVPTMLWVVAIETGGDWVHAYDLEAERIPHPLGCSYEVPQRPEVA